LLGVVLAIAILSILVIFVLVLGDDFYDYNLYSPTPIVRRRGRGRRIQSQFLWRRREWARGHGISRLRADCGAIDLVDIRDIRLQTGRAYIRHLRRIG
jgi:hypothetical protein